VERQNADFDLPIIAQGSKIDKNNGKFVLFRAANITAAFGTQ
jgi:hypothetical protein